MFGEARDVQSRPRRVLVAIVLLVGFAASLAAESKRFNCNAGGRVYQTTLATNGVFPVTLTWTKPDPDNDIFLFDPASGQLLGIGIGLSKRYEHVAIAGLIGLPVDIVLTKASGPNGTCLLRWSGELTDTGSARPRRVRSLGSLADLAASRPKYAQMKATIEEYQALKRRFD